MKLDLTEVEIDTIHTSLIYSKQRVSDALGTPNDVRKDTLQRIDDVTAKIREARKK